MVPVLLGKDVSLLQRASESPELRYYRERAEAESTLAKKRVKPEELIKKEIQTLTPLLAVTETPKNLKRKIQSLEKLLFEVLEQTMTENEMIQRDVFHAERRRLPAPRIAPKVDKHYSLPGGRSLRIRMLHPNRAEQISGADLVYEFCDEEEETARFAFVQYKVWNKERLPLSPRDFRQIERLKRNLCGGNFCKKKSAPSDNCYRMPFCSGFLRLTNKLQKQSSRLISAGALTPVCMIDGEKSKSLSRRDIHRRLISSELFEEAFVEGVAGSDWMSYKEVEALYKRCEILSADDRLVIYAQEMPRETERG